MEDLKEIFAENLIKLRKEVKLTQAELAEKINYSDKAVSKWERGESVPDISVLKTIADLFGVTVDFLITKHDESKDVTEELAYVKNIKKKNRLIITLLPIVAIFAISTVIFVALQKATPSPQNAIYCYVLPLPLCALIAFIFSAIWAKRVLKFILLSLFIWLLVLDAYFIVGFLVEFYGLIFVIGVPAEIVIMMSFGIIQHKPRIK